VHGGRFICRCVAMVRAEPSSLYGFSQRAMANTPPNPSASPTSAPRTQAPSAGATYSTSSLGSLLVDNGGELIPITRVRCKRNVRSEGSKANSEPRTQEQFFRFHARLVEGLLNPEPVVLEGLVVEVGGHVDRGGRDAHHGAERPGHGEAVPAAHAPGPA